MPNLTPLKYRRLYEIYPDKACVGETGEACSGCLRRPHSIPRVGKSAARPRGAVEGGLRTPGARGKRPGGGATVFEYAPS